MDELATGQASAGKCFPPAHHAPISGDVLLTRADRQRYKIPIYNLTTGQPLPDVKGEGNLALHFDNSAFHSLFPDAESAIVRIPKPPDRASPVEVAAHQARRRELVEQGIEIDGQRYDLVLTTDAHKHGDFLASPLVTDWGARRHYSELRMERIPALSIR